MCGQRLPQGGNIPRTASAALRRSCGCSMLREGENAAAYRFSRPSTRSASTEAAAIDPVIPHFWKPAAAYSPGVLMAENCAGTVLNTYVLCEDGPMTGWKAASGAGEWIICLIDNTSD